MTASSFASIAAANKAALTAPGLPTANVATGTPLGPSRGHGAMAARLTPDQKVGSSNLSALISNPLGSAHKGSNLGVNIGSLCLNC